MGDAESLLAAVVGAGLFLLGFDAGDFANIADFDAADFADFNFADFNLAPVSFGGGSGVDTLDVPNPPGVSPPNTFPAGQPVLSGFENRV